MGTSHNSNVHYSNNSSRCNNPAGAGSQAAALITRPAGENSLSVIAEDADDLLSLRRVIRPGDRITGDTTRVLKKQQGSAAPEYSRPGKGERVRIRIALDVERISLDNVLDKLRVSGTIHESSNDSVPSGLYHSLVLKINDGFTIHKKARWPPAERRLLTAPAGAHAGFVLVAIDTAECGIARLVGTHLEIVPNIYSGFGGKRYKTHSNMAGFFEDSYSAMSAVRKNSDRVMVFGPGQTKKRFANYVEAADSRSSSNNSGGGNRAGSSNNIRIQVVEGIDSGGEDGIYTFTKSQALREIMSDSKLASVSHVIDEIMMLAYKTSKRFTMGFEQTRDANRMGAIECLVFSERAIQDNDEQEVMNLLNDAEGKGARIYSVDSSTDIGLRVTGLGGIVALLRYAAAG